MVLLISDTMPHMDEQKETNVMSQAESSAPVGIASDQAVEAVVEMREVEITTGPVVKPDAMPEPGAQKRVQGHKAAPAPLPSLADRMLAGLSYVFVLFLIPVAFGRRKMFVYGHAQQGVAMFALCVIVSFLAWIPYVGPLLLLAYLALDLVAVVQALRGEEWRIPVVGAHVAKLRI